MWVLEAGARSTEQWQGTSGPEGGAAAYSSAFSAVDQLRSMVKEVPEEDKESKEVDRTHLMSELLKRTFALAQLLMVARIGVSKVSTSAKPAASSSIQTGERGTAEGRLWRHCVFYSGLTSELPLRHRNKVSHPVC